MTYEIHNMDCRVAMSLLMAPKSVHTCVTSPPYFNLRNYGHDGQIGLEPTVEEFVAETVSVFREVHRVLRDDGTLWLNLGDSYAGSGCGARDVNRWPKQSRNDHMPTHGKKRTGLSDKQMLGIPWRVAFALQEDGWILRQEIIWHKPNPMPESVKDRCTKAHEQIFLFSKSPRYYFDADAIDELAVGASPGNTRPTKAGREYAKGVEQHRTSANLHVIKAVTRRNKRSVWTVPPKPFRGAHFATFPPDLIEPCILAGAPPGGTVLDPFGGSGTVAYAAEKHGRNSVLCDLDPRCEQWTAERIATLR